MWQTKQKKNIALHYNLAESTKQIIFRYSAKITLGQHIQTVSILEPKISPKNDLKLHSRPIDKLSFSFHHFLWTNIVKKHVDHLKRKKERVDYQSFSK